MSAKSQLMEAVAQVSEHAAREILTQIQPWLDTGISLEKPIQDYYQSYWKLLYGSMEDAEWPEPAELPFEPREAW